MKVNNPENEAALSEGQESSMPRKLDYKDKGKGVPAPCHVTYGKCTGQLHVMADLTPLTILRDTHWTEGYGGSQYTVELLTEMQTLYFGRLTSTALTLPVVAQG